MTDTPKTYGGKLAVITGAATGMGRELAKQLSAEGCHLALCDVNEQEMETTRQQALAEAPSDSPVNISTHRCDVSVEEEVLAFRDAALSAHDTDAVDLLFNNAGIGGGGSLFGDERAEWDKTFGVCWGGVYYCTRAFLEAITRSEAGHIVNTSSVNGFWASLGARTPHTAYSAAKFAVKGFSEALITDLRVNAPQVKVSVVMPGHIGTDIMLNSGRVLGHSEPMEMTDDEVAQARRRLMDQQLPDIDITALSDDEIRAVVHQRANEFRDEAPMNAADASRVILDGVRAGRWRILVGDDAALLDQLVRAQPELAYDEAFLEALQQQGHFQAATQEDLTAEVTGD